MKSIYLVLLGVLGGLLGAGLIWLIASQPRGDPVILQPPPSPEPIAVHVAGAVAAPGVYALPIGSRVRDALESAGGLLEDAEAQSINLAARLEDGDQLWVPEKGSQQTQPPSGDAAPEPGITRSGSSFPQASSKLIEINSATQEELESLPGIGPATALKIIAYRDENGNFKTAEEIMNVSGIGPATFERIKDLIAVSD